MLSWATELLPGILHHCYSDKDHQHAPALLRLPPESFDHILDALDNSEIACLSLCNRALSHKLGAISWSSLFVGTGSDSQRRYFLLRLARDHQDYFFCYTCSHLHPVALVGPPRRTQFQWPRKPCLRCVTRPGVQELPICCFTLYSSYFLAFQHLQLAMDRHRYGLGYGIALDTLSITEVQTSEK